MHYLGWKEKWDEWIGEHRIMKGSFNFFQLIFFRLVKINFTRIFSHYILSVLEFETGQTGLESG